MRLDCVKGVEQCFIQFDLGVPLLSEVNSAKRWRFARSLELLSVHLPECNLQAINAVFLWAFKPVVVDALSIHYNARTIGDLHGPYHMVAVVYEVYS